MNKDGKIVILAVDDKPEILASIADMLKGTFDIICVTSGNAALRALQRHKPDIFVLDIEMPKMDGYQLAHLIREDRRHKTTPIIFLTGKNTRDDVMLAFKNGGNDYVLKPVEKNMLLEKIRKFI